MAKKNNNKNKGKNNNNKPEPKLLSLVVSLIMLYIVVIILFNMFKSKSIVDGFKVVLNNFKTNPLGYILPMVAASFGIVLGKFIGKKKKKK